jgi:5,5'-dehydrodivanillate O-demethylase oxygenase subunit
MPVTLQEQSMLSAQENELLTRIGPGTACGDLMRRYWQPVATTIELDGNPVKPVRILGEDLILYRDRQAGLGLIGPRCPHRAVDLRFGIPEDAGLRCPYHGWMFNAEGRCIQQPLEPPDSTYKDRVSLPGYPVQEMGGLIWAYLGPTPAPLLPEWDLFTRPDAFRQIIAHRLPCNWLQVMENRGDHLHAVYLHGRLFQYALERQGRLTDDPKGRYNATMKLQADRLRRGVYARTRAVPNPYGFTKTLMESDRPEDSPEWQLGYSPVIFPYTVYPVGAEDSIRHDYQFGVPIDDTHTWHITYRCYVFPPELEVPTQERVPYVEVPLQNDKGEYILDYVLGQDMVAWYAQGEITDRTQEHLTAGDACLLYYRKLLREQIELVQAGQEPMNTFRDPATNQRLRTPVHTGSDRVAAYYRANFHKFSQGGWRYIEDDVDRYCPDKELIIQLYARAEALAQRQMDMVSAAR